MLSHHRAPIPVLTYHRVLPTSGPITISVSDFELQMRWLKSNGYTTLSGAQFEKYLSGQLDVVRPVLLTFDDGYLDNLYLALPILKRYGFCASLFVITSKIGNVRTDVVGSWNEQDDDRHLVWSEIDEMVASGVFDVHSHTHTHTQFWLNEVSAVQTQEKMLEDVSKSLDILRAKYSHDVQLAWPWGYFRSSWLPGISELAVSVCHTMRPGTNFAGSDQQTVRRLNENTLTKYGKSLFRAASHPLLGPVFNAGASAWGTLRGRS